MRERGVPVAWRFSQSAIVGLLMLLGCAAAISLSGVVHELAWLPQGEITRSNQRSNQTLAVSNARQLGMVLFEYDSEFGRLPLALKDLDKLDDGLNGQLPRLIHLRFDSSSPPEPFILRNPGGAIDPDPNSVILIRPLIPDTDKFVVLKSDMSVTSLPAGRFAEVLKSGKVTTPAGK